MRARLGEGKATEHRWERVGEEIERDVVGGCGASSERVARLFEAFAVVLDQLVCSACRILDRLVVAGKGDSRIELDDPLQRLEVVAERIGA